MQAEAGRIDAAREAFLPYTLWRNMDEWRSCAYMEVQ